MGGGSGTLASVPRLLAFLACIVFLAHPAGAAPLADSPLTPLAVAEAERALALVTSGQVQDRTDLPPLDAAQVVGVTVDIAVQPAGGAPVARLSLLLSAEGLTLQGADPSELSSLPRFRQDPSVGQVAATFSSALATGSISDQADRGLASCLVVWGEDCLNADGAWVPSRLPRSLRSALGEEIDRALITRTQVVLRAADGRTMHIEANWGVGKKRRPGPDGPVRASVAGRWGDPPPQPHPPDHLDPGWSRWCAHDWPRLSTPPRDVSSRCLLQLLSDAYDSPIHGGRIRDMLMLDFDPLPPPDEANVQVDKLEAMKGHLAHRCQRIDRTPCGRVLQSLQMAIDRKTSLVEGPALGDFTWLLGMALRGEPLPEDLGATGRARWSRLTLDKLAAAVWARNGYVIARRDLASFFYGDRSEMDPGAALLPLDWRNSEVSELDETDRDNLSRIRSHR